MSGVKKDIKTKKISVNPSSLSKVISPIASNAFLESKPVPEHLDSQKEFFKLMSEKIKQEKISEESDDMAGGGVNNKAVGLYRKMAMRFILAAVILVVVVAYFCLVKMTIVIEPKKELVNDALIVDVSGGNNVSSSSQALIGKIVRLEIEENGNFPSTGTKTDEAKFSGQVIIYNTHIKDQPLVASTRLLSSDNNLFRLKSSVVVPAGGQVTVEVYPDKTNTSPTISAGKFTIPGLWEGLQSKIYAQSTQDFSLASSTIKVVSQIDIDNATAQLNAWLIEKAKKEVSLIISADSEVVYGILPGTAQIDLGDVKVGDAKDTFALKVKNIVTVTSFAKSDLDKLILKKMSQNLKDTQTLAPIDSDNLKYSLDSYDLNSNIATVKVDYSAQVADRRADFINKSKIVNLRKDQVENYLHGIKEIDKFELKFWPSFFNRSPYLVDQIKVEFK